MSISTLLLVGIIVLITHTLEGITGFGCTAIAMPFVVMLVGVTVAKPALTILGFLLCLYIVIISFKDIIWKEFIRITAFVGLGLPFGLWAFSKLPEAILIKLLAIFIILIAIRGIYISFTSYKPAKQTNNILLNFILFLGGFIHGAFTSGGPIVTIYATEALPKKNNFRATLCMLWVVLNGIIIVQSAAKGLITSDVIELLEITIPFLIVGALIGNWAHHKIKDTYFSKIVFIVLLLTGLFMVK
ncbi:TSUP family transporter [Clostridium beijerinckii]|uniref:TSUP family transporter n=1 Tax=Clostridium beijerinckii TaxID=1520 RepID=UPI0022DF32A5|nr:TSUP family transporter [Clostridium beijerinckii]